MAAYGSLYEFDTVVVNMASIVPLSFVIWV